MLSLSLKRKQTHCFGLAVSPWHVSVSAAARLPGEACASPWPDPDRAPFSDFYAPLRPSPLRTLPSGVCHLVSPSMPVPRPSRLPVLFTLFGGAATLPWAPRLWALSWELMTSAAAWPWGSVSRAEPAVSRPGSCPEAPQHGALQAPVRPSQHLGASVACATARPPWALSPPPRGAALALTDSLPCESALRALCSLRPRNCERARGGHCHRPRRRRGAEAS